MELAADFSEGIKPLPDAEQNEYFEKQHEVANTRRRAQLSERLLHLRVR